MKKYVTVFCLVISFLICMGCSANGGTEATIGKGNEEPNEFNFILKDLDGNPHRLQDYHGKFVVLNNWTTWCKPCIEEMPLFEKLHQKYKDSEDVVVLLVNATTFERSSSDDVVKFIKDNKITIPSLFDTKGHMKRYYQLHAFPTTIFIKPNGEVYHTQIGGPFGEDFLESTLASMKKSIQ